MSCNVCTNDFNKSNRLRVNCKCNFDVCRACTKTYLLSKIENCHCMSCKVEWDRQFISLNFENNFMMKDYRDHREKILIEREIGMLQATQPYVEREMKFEKMNVEKSEIYKDYSAKINCINRKYEIDKKKINGEYKVRLNDLNTRYENVNIEKDVRRKFVRKCPSNDCHGFLSSSLKCDLCGIFACSNCREITGKNTIERESHVCDKDIVESVKLIEKDSKPCPKCASMTFKIDGCHQMYCVDCNTPWDWVSGRVISGRFHNPHYVEFLASKNNGLAPREIHEVLCGREIDRHFITRLSKIFPVSDYSNAWLPQPSINEFYEIAGKVIHMRIEEIPRFNRIDQLTENLKMRIDFMRNKINKGDFKSKIQKKEKSNDMKHEINNVLGMFINSITDILYRLTRDNQQDIKSEISQLKIYTNGCFIGISRSFNCKAYLVDEHLNLIRSK